MPRSTKLEPALPQPWKRGAGDAGALAERLIPADRPGSERQHAAASGGGFLIPDFCSSRTVFVVVLIAELVAVTLSLARPAEPFLLELARMSMFLQWLALTSAALLCYSRGWLMRLSVPWVTVAVLAILVANTAAISIAATLLGREVAGGAADVLFPRDLGSFLLRSEGICLIVAAMLLRYWFVTQQWRHHVRAEARSRIEALQARIRPHFLFNSMNTIASLTRSDPKRAEEAVEDLADLFRATLRDSQSPLRLKEELELTRIYQRIEELRLGERLKVRWDVAALPMRAFIPGLTIQPLLENAIYHGIEPLPSGGSVTVAGRVEAGQVTITVTNPVGAEREAAAERPGNRLALDNIRQRLWLAYGDRGALDVERRPGEYEVTIRFPYEE
jgi:two-component system sensor histidine kinase AlgZ